MNSRPTFPRRAHWRFAPLCEVLILGMPLAGASLARADDTAAQAANETEPRDAEATAEKSVAPPATVAEVARWIHELDDDQYAIRQTAEDRLAAAGLPALAAVSKAARSGSLESATRAVSVLLKWADAEDNDLALSALERLAALTNRPAEAAVAAARIADFRETAALAAIRKLGGVSKDDEQVPRSDPWKAPIQVVIGPKWKGGVEGLRYLRDIPRLTTVSLHGAPLGAEALPQLMPLTQAKRVEFYGQTLPEDDVAKLRAALPQAKVEVRGPCRLGIAGGQVLGNKPGAYVDHVVGTPALKAGLKGGDVITHIDGKAVKDFLQLTEEISRCDPSKEVKLKIDRNGTTLELSVAFDRWGEEETPPPALTDAAQVQRAIIIQQPQQPQLPQPIVVPRR